MKRLKRILLIFIILAAITGCAKPEEIIESPVTPDTVRAMPFGLFEPKGGYIYYNPIDKPDEIYKISIYGDGVAKSAEPSEIPSKSEKELSFDPDVLFADKLYIEFYCSYGDLVFYSNYSDNGRLYCIRTDGSEDEKVLDASTCDFFIDDGKMYYIDQTGTKPSFEENIHIYRDSKEGIPFDFENFGRIRIFEIEGKFENNRLKRILSDNGISAEERHLIDISYEKAMANPEVWTTYGMAETTYQHGDMWKAEMEKYIELLTEILNAEKKKWVLESQEKWEIFTKDNEELAWQVYDAVNHGGSIMTNHTAGIYYDKYRTRALYLKSLYDFLTIDGY